MWEMRLIIDDNLDAWLVNMTKRLRKIGHKDMTKQKVMSYLCFYGRAGMEAHAKRQEGGGKVELKLVK